MVFRKTLKNTIVQLSLLILLAFILQIFAASQGLMEKYFVLQTPLAEHPWTAVTAVFAHSGINHLTSNLTGLILFGIPVAYKASKLKFYLFFIITGSLAGISQVLTSYYMYNLGIGSEPVGVVGASGAIFAVIGYFMTSNRVSNYTSNLIPIPNKIRYLLYIAVATWITFATASPQSALIGHFTGLLIGLVAGKANILKASTNSVK